MAEREFTAYVTLREPIAGEIVNFEPGDIVPEWAVVGDHAAASAGTTKAVQTSEESPANVVVTNDDGSTTEIVTPEDELDETEEVDEEDEIPPYTEWSKTDLQAEAKGRGLTGLSKATIEELSDALTADDAENAE